MKKDFADIIKKLDNVSKHMGERVAPQVNKLLKESVARSLVDWYNDYDPEIYKRTYNFMNILERTNSVGRGNVVELSVDWDGMSDYPSFFADDSVLQADTAFDFFFNNGWHGYGKWLKHRSTPLAMEIDRDVANGWWGRLDKIVDNELSKILGK